MKDTMVYGGIDGCKYGWILITSKDKNLFFGGLYTTITELINYNPAINRCFIDIPIGLSSKGHLRTVDTLLRKELQGKASSVFNAPSRASLYANSYEEAKVINLQVEHKSISKQTFFISNKIKEVDTMLQNYPSYRSILLESHPELCFKKLNNNKALDKKSTTKGIEQRTELLEQYCSSAKRLYNHILENTKRKEVKPDDILDAMCLAITNELAGRHNIQFISDPLVQDNLGIPMRVGYYDTNH